MANTGAHCHESMHVTAPKSVKMEGCVAKDMIWRKGTRSCLTKVAMVTILLALQSTATTARQCTVIPAGSPSNQSASSALAKNTTFNSTNSSVGLATPTTTPRPATQAAAEFQIAENPVSSNVNNQAAKITSDLDALNQTIRNITHRGFFPDVQLNDDVESGVAVLLIVIGVFCSTLGAQYGKILFVVMAFLAGVIISMYPIDSLLGNTLCGPFPCSPTGPGCDSFPKYCLKSVSSLLMLNLCQNTAMNFADGRWQQEWRWDARRRRRLSRSSGNADWYKSTCFAGTKVQILTQCVLSSVLE